MRNALEDDVLHHRIHPHVNEKPAFSKICTLESDFKKMHFGRPNRGNKSTFSNKNGYVSTGPNIPQRWPWWKRRLKSEFAFFQSCWSRAVTPTPGAGWKFTNVKKCDALVKFSSFACVLPALFSPFVEMLFLILFSRQLHLGWIVTHARYQICGS